MHRLALYALLALAAAGIAGCWPLFTPVEPAPTDAPQITRAEPLTSMPPTEVSQQPEHHKSKRAASKSAHTSTSDHQAPEAVSSPAPEAAPPILTLAGESASRAQAQQAVDTADRNLAKIDRSRLTGNDLATYDQASGFVSSAQHAMTQDDYFAASGLALKASLLTSQLAR